MRKYPSFFLLSACLAEIEILHAAGKPSEAYSAYLLDKVAVVCVVVAEGLVVVVAVEVEVDVDEEVDVVLDVDLFECGAGREK